MKYRYGRGLQEKEREKKTKRKEKKKKEEGKGIKKSLTRAREEMFLYRLRSTQLSPIHGSSYNVSRMSRR